MSWVQRSFGPQTEVGWCDFSPSLPVRDPSFRSKLSQRKIERSPFGSDGSQTKLGKDLNRSGMMVRKKPLYSQLYLSEGRWDEPPITTQRTQTGDFGRAHQWVTLVGSSLRSNGFPPVMGGRVAESSCTPSCLGLCGQVRAAGQWAGSQGSQGAVWAFSSETTSHGSRSRLSFLGVEPALNHNAIYSTGSFGF